MSSKTFCPSRHLLARVFRNAVDPVVKMPNQTFKRTTLDDGPRYIRDEANAGPRYIRVS